MDSASRWAVVALLVGLVGCWPSGTERAPMSRRSGRESPPVVPASAREILALTARGGARATLVNVWATWCAPCREEFPVLLRVARAHEPEGLRLLLVSADFQDQLPAVGRFLSAQGVSDTTYLKTGDDMTFIDTLDPRWSGALPATFVYDGSGTLTAFWEGSADEDRFRSSVEEALARHSPREDSRP